jgi:hypothetical protein
LKYPKIGNNTSFRQRTAQFQLLLPARLPRAEVADPQANRARLRRFRPDSNAVGQPRGKTPQDRYPIT